ncbi:DUF4124 domain-containing protein [bacterium]|nr:DUF4124 domain-containing protein [bacterium]
MNLWQTTLVVFIPVLLLAQIYFWVDENGVKHYSSTPPPEEAKVEDYKEKETASPEELEQERKALEEAIAEQEKQRSAGRFPRIVMYSTRESNTCQIARNFFKQNRIPYKDYHIEESEEYYQKFQALGGEGVPFILVGEKKVKGWNEEMVRFLLGLD